MPLIEPIAPTLCFRELSPEVSPEVMAQLDLGDPPDPLKRNAHPVARLLWQHSKRQQADILYLAKDIGDEKNVNKSLRRIREVFSGEKLHPFWIERLANCLVISPADLEKARERAVEWEARRAAFELRQQRHRLFARLGAYLRVITAKDSEAILPPGSDPRPRIHCDVFSIPGDSELGEIREWIVSRSKIASWGEMITGYHYHRYPDEVYFFDSKGVLLAHENMTPIRFEQ